MIHKGIYMAKLVILFCTLLSLSNLASASITPPNFKYSVGDCIVNVEPTYSWFAQYVTVDDIVYSTRYETYVYFITFYNYGSPNGFFNVEAIESTTKLAHPSKCRQVN